MALAIGTPAPDFTLQDGDRNAVSLSAQRGSKVVLAFFPAAFTGVCKAELCSFQNAIQRLNGMNAKVLAVAADAPFSNKAFAEANGLTFPVLSDYSRETIKAYDVALEDFAGLSGYTASQRATFVIDADGVIRHVDVTENPGIEPNYDAIYVSARASTSVLA
jgi:peroxiredoxin